MQDYSPPVQLMAQAQAITASPIVPRFFKAGYRILGENFSVRGNGVDCRRLPSRRAADDSQDIVDLRESQSVLDMVRHHESLPRHRAQPNGFNAYATSLFRCSFDRFISGGFQEQECNSTAD